MATVARNQITIVDLNDAKQVHAYLDSTLGDTQIYNPDTKVFTPNFASTNNKITPKVYETGNANNLITACSNFKYTINNKAYTASSSDASYVVGSDGSLTIKSNISTNSLVIVFSCDFTDTETKVVTKIEAYKTIVKSQSAGALFQAVIELPKGNVFDSATSAADLQAICKTFRGGTEDNTNITFTWEKLNTETGTWGAVVSGRAANATLTVKPEDVLNFQTFRCTAKDTGGTDAAAQAIALVTFEDKTDPYELELVSTTGDKIINGQGSTTINARVWQSGTKIEDETTAEGSRKFIYTWTKYDKDGELANFNGTTASTKTGNPLIVAAVDVTSKATFICEIAKK